MAASMSANYTDINVCILGWKCYIWWKIASTHHVLWAYTVDKIKIYKTLKGEIKVSAQY